MNILVFTSAEVSFSASGTYPYACSQRDYISFLLPRYESATVGGQVIVKFGKYTEGPVAGASNSVGEDP